MGDCQTSTLLSLQHLVLLVWPYSPHFSQTDAVRYVRSTGALSEASQMNMSIRLSSKENFLARCSLYLLINLLQASDPSSEKHFKPYPKLLSLKFFLSEPTICAKWGKCLPKKKNQGLVDRYFYKDYQTLQF